VDPLEPTLQRRPFIFWRVVNRSEQMKSLLLHFLGTLLVVCVTASAVAALPQIDLPKSYDPRNTSLAACISPALDQGSCGSCFAFAAASVFSDRLCLAFGPKGSPAGNNSYISPQDALSCSHEGGCYGGRAIDVWQNLYATSGARTCTNLCNAGTPSTITFLSSPPRKKVKIFRVAKLDLCRFVSSASRCI
jgi:hypothetical protein